MFFSLYTIDERQRRIGKNTEQGGEPYILYSPNVTLAQNYLSKLGIPHQCEIIDGDFYTVEDADINVCNGPSGPVATIKVGVGLDSSFMTS